MHVADYERAYLVPDYGILFVMGFPAVTRTAHAQSVVLAEISTLTLFTLSDAPLTFFTVLLKKCFNIYFAG